MPTHTQSRRIDPTAVAEDEIATLTNATVTLPVDKIRRDGGTQIRLQIDTDKVAEYAEMIGAGIITVHGLVFYDGSDYWLGDGFHRCAGLIELKRTHAHVEVRAGTRRDAVLYAATQANNKHGLPLTKEDRRNAALTLLRDADWSAWTDREIARRVGLSHPTVAKLRVQVEEERRRNAAAQTEARSETQGKRRYMRNGQIQEMAVENIGNTPTTRQLVAAWLDQRSSSSPAARRVLVQQLINNDPTGKLLLRGLIQYLPGIDNTDDVLPHLRAELAKLEETAVVDGETYQQVTADLSGRTDAAASPETTVEPGEETRHWSKAFQGEDEHNWKNLPDTHSTPTPLTVNEAAAVIAASQPKPGTKTHTSPKQPMTQRSNPVTDLAASYEKHVIAWAKAQCAAGNYTTLKDAASAALKPDSEAFASMCAYMAEHVDAQKDWTQNGALIIAIGDVAWRLVKEENPPAHTADDDDAAPATIATNDDDATAAPNQQSSPRRFLRGELEGGFLSDTGTAASHQQAPLSQSDGRGAGGEGLSAAAFTTVSAFAGHVAVNHTEEIATEAWNTPDAALAAAQRGEAKPKHYRALQALQAKKEEEPEENNYLLNLKRQDAATLRAAVDDARRQIDRLACTVASQTLGQPFERLHTDIVTKLRSLQTLLNDQYPKEGHES